jgi:hypothetical protein
MAINNEALLDAAEGKDVLAVGEDSDVPGMSGAHWISRRKTFISSTAPTSMTKAHLSPCRTFSRWRNSRP